MIVQRFASTTVELSPSGSSVVCSLSFLKRD